MDTPPAALDRFGTGPRQSAPSPPPMSAFPGSEDVDPTRVFAGPGYTSPPPPGNAMARVAVWLCVAGFLLPVLLPVSTVLAGVGLARSSRVGGVGREAALAALVISLLAMLLGGGFYLLVRGA